MARELEWTRYDFLGIGVPEGSNGTHTIQTYVAGATITRIRFTPLFTGSEQVPFGSVGAWVAYGIYALPESEAASYLPLDNRTDVDWLWWECVPLDAYRVHSTWEPEVLPAWSTSGTSAGPRDCKAQRVSREEPLRLIWSWQLHSALTPQVRAWATMTASVGVLAPA